MSMHLIYDETIFLVKNGNIFMKTFYQCLNNCCNYQKNSNNKCDISVLDAILLKIIIIMIIMKLD